MSDHIAIQLQERDKKRDLMFYANFQMGLGLHSFSELFPE